jgi:SM-20-related protein
MEKDFELLIAGFIENRIGIADHFLSDDLCEHLKSHLILLHADRLLLIAGVGNGEKLSQNNSIRSDAIYWLDRKHHNIYENEFLDQIDAFIIYLNNSCYCGITDYEFHFSLYEAGSFYKKHIDQFQNHSGRQYSLISYLNNNWQESDGGQLMVHQNNSNQKISPTQGKTVFFKSNELEHEVLLTKQIRMSVTGWLKKI